MSDIVLLSVCLFDKCTRVRMRQSNRFRVNFEGRSYWYFAEKRDFRNLLTSTPRISLRRPGVLLGSAGQDGQSCFSTAFLAMIRVCLRSVPSAG